MHEGALIFASIIVGVAVTDLLTSFHRLLRARARVRWDWLTLGVAALVLLSLLQVWWRLASGDGSAPLTLGAFLPTLAVLIILFLLAAAVLPDEVGGEPLDLTDHYREQARIIWTLFALALTLLLVSGAATEIRAGADWRAVALQKSGDLLVVGLFISLAVVRQRRWHEVAFLLLLATGPLGWLALRLG